MRWTFFAAVCIGLSACGAAPQPESIKTVAAFEVPLPTEEDRNQFLSVLRTEAVKHGMHLDAESNEELARQTHDDPLVEMTLNAEVWKGANDDEPVAGASDDPDHLGRVWIMFSKGTNSTLNRRFQENTVREIMRKWPGTLSLPIMPTGGIPLSRDLVRTPDGYVVNPADAHKYELQKP